MTLLTQSLLLDPSFLNSFLPLEKKPFFFLAGAERSACVGLSAGGGQLASNAAGAGPGAEPRSDGGLAVEDSLGGGSVCSVGSTVWG